MDYTKRALQNIDRKTHDVIKEMSQAFGIPGSKIVNMALFCLYEKIKEHRVLLPGRRPPIIPEWDAVSEAAEKNHDTEGS